MYIMSLHFIVVSIKLIIVFKVKELVKMILPRKSVAFKGVPVKGWTLASHEGTSLALPITQRYLACPNIATKSDATIPRLAPAPTTFPAQPHPILRKATAYDALFDIYNIIFHVKGLGYHLFFMITDVNDKRFFFSLSRVSGLLE